MLNLNAIICEKEIHARMTRVYVCRSVVTYIADEDGPCLEYDSYSQ